MLVYHPAFDINHARFRMLELLDLSDEPGLPFDTLRILDFYFLFPHLLGHVMLTRSMTKQKRALAARSSKYNHVPTPKLLMRQMQGIHETAIGALVADGFIGTALLDVGIIKRTDKTLPSELQNIIASQSEEERSLAKFLALDLAKIPLTGQDGLKARTGLLEYRYDPV